jgi:hypothetical protein
MSDCECATTYAPINLSWKPFCLSKRYTRSGKIAEIVKLLNWFIAASSLCRPFRFFTVRCIPEMRDESAYLRLAKAGKRSENFEIISSSPRRIRRPERFLVRIFARFLV